MKILELNISDFGRLKNTRLELGDGINIISGDNESGKSTIMLFIRFMFYGLPKKSQKSNFRERSLSFDTHRAAGSMLIEHDGRQYRIERIVNSASKTNESLNIFDMRSGELIKGEPWELFLGVGAEVFESSCAILQSRASNIDKAGASRALENILASADESIDVSGVLENIDKVRREYKLNRGEGGILYELNKEIAELRAKQQRALEKQLETNRLGAHLDKLEAELEAVRSEKEAAQKSLELAKKMQILSGFDALAIKQQEKNMLIDELNTLDAQFPHKNITANEQTAADIENACQRIRSARDKINVRREEHGKIKKRSEENFPLASIGERLSLEGGAEPIVKRATSAHRSAKAFTALAVICLIACVGAVALALTITAILFAVCGAFAVCAIVFTVLSAKKRANAKALCREYGQDTESLGTYLEKCLSDFNGQQKAKYELTAAAAKLEDAEQDLLNAQNSLLSLLPQDSADTGTDALLTFCAKICADIRALCAAKGAVELKIAACDALIASHKTSLANYNEQELRAELAEAAIIPMSVADAERALSFATSKKESLERNIGAVRENLAASRASAGQTPVELGDRISALESSLESRSRYFDALMLAKQTIERASDAMSGNVTPEISRKASEILELVSGGRHPALRTTKQLELSVDEDGFGFSAELLSEGTRDAAYIALRISLMLRIFGDQLPLLMLDDALCQFDDGRAKIMIELISKLSALPLQTVIFTCHARERAICEENGISHTYTHLH